MTITTPVLLALLRGILAREPYISYWRSVNGRLVRFIDWRAASRRA